MVCIPQVKCHACVGGTSVREDARILGAGVHVVVGTPGRVYDMLRRRCLRADSIKVGSHVARAHTHMDECTHVNECGS